MVELADTVDGDGNPHKITRKCRVGTEKITWNLRVVAVKPRPQGDEIRRIHGHKIIQDEAKRHDLPSLK